MGLSRSLIDLRKSSRLTCVCEQFSCNAGKVLVDRANDICRVVREVLSSITYARLIEWDTHCLLRFAA